MTRAPDETEARLLGCFENVCAVLEKENDLLIATRLEEVADLLPAKQKEMQALEDLLAPGEDAMTPAEARQLLLTPKTEEAARRFGALVRTNRKLLQNAIEAQNALIRLIVVDAAQESSTGYAASGRYAVNKVTQAALTLRSDV
ncbi:hypothetical protein [Komagataeibacter sp. FNDCR2]|uniref:hypothetical protein n=1 Tax=Komagataeibacter sp. FNDCR2 TaxID=2878682 RepID=UPI001E3B5136|nr:hypothetical protein [Komagataeibacter sp. FNDCR2]MCE2576822.1 hypothetical protein [Komagataeibacter sp. FNDCR2]